METHKKSPNDSVDMPLATRITAWVNEMTGVFTVRDVDEDLKIKTQEEKRNRSKILHRLVASDVIVRHGSRYGIFRKRNAELRRMNLKATVVTPHWITLPLGIRDFAEVLPGSMIGIAGEKSAGKTAYLINTCILNIEEARRRGCRIHYWNSEMNESDFLHRLIGAGINKKWEFVETYDRSSDFEDVIFPDDINVIDYLILPSKEMWSVGEMLRKIHDRAKRGKGITIVALQKDPGKLWARGGYSWLDVVKLAVLLEKGTFGNRCVIEEAKYFKENGSYGNPRGYSCRYLLGGGVNFKIDTKGADGGWTPP